MKRRRIGWRLESVQTEETAANEKCAWEREQKKDKDDTRKGEKREKKREKRERRERRESEKTPNHSKIVNTILRH